MTQYTIELHIHIVYKEVLGEGGPGGVLPKLYYGGVPE